ncbi:MAG: BamA/TamA family outer membrane protein [Bacteroidales bacterium]|nr:BamA/TamA family outer membrane protein [Bacteroidales bacterium]
MSIDPAKYAIGPVWLFLALFLALAGIGHAQQIDGSRDKGDRFISIDKIVLEGNRITRDPIILREIVFKEGDFIRSAALDSLIGCSRNNLLNTLLFNFVEINANHTDSSGSSVVVGVKVVERWYIWPTPIFKLSDRNFNVWWETRDPERLSYGFYIDWKNFRGRKEELILRFQWGYDRLIQLQYQVPYLNRSQTMGLGVGFGFARQKESAFRTLNNKQEFIRLDSGFARKDLFAYSQLTVRNNIHITHTIQAGFDQHHFSDSLIRSNPDFTNDTSTVIRYFSLSYQYKNDHRDFKSYPLKGYYADFGLVKNGLWTFPEKTINSIQITATYRKYWELNPRIYLATGINGYFSAGRQPYFVLGGIGYDRDIVRAYEYYLIDAEHFVILKNNVKFALIPNREHRFQFIRAEKFARIFYALYLNLFVDAGYGYYSQEFGQTTNDLQNSLLIGYGAGLDFVTYYDVVVRLDFSVNYRNEAGFYLHFRAPI